MVSYTSFALVMAGHALIALGAGYAWGWPVGFMALGIVIVTWQLVKTVVQAL